MLLDGTKIEFTFYKRWRGTIYGFRVAWKRENILNIYRRIKIKMIVI